MLMCFQLVIHNPDDINFKNYEQRVLLYLSLLIKTANLKGYFRSKSNTNVSPL